MQNKLEEFKRRNRKPIQQYKKLLGWCAAWIVTVVCTMGVSAMLGGIMYELVR